MNSKFRVIAASIALAMASGAQAQQASGTPGASPAGQPSQAELITQQHQAAMDKCNTMKDNAKDICKAEADGQKKIAEAQAKLSERDTPKNRLELGEAKAEAQYKVAKEKCDDQVGDAKNACQKEAKATRDMAMAQARKQSQTAASSGGGSPGGTSAAGSGSAPVQAPATASPGAGQPAQPR